MNGVIYRYELRVTDRQQLSLPKGATFLAAQAKEGPTLGTGSISVWCMLPDPDAEQEEMTVVIIGTGNPIEESLDQLLYLATVQMPPFVWHLFELWPAE